MTVETLEQMAGLRHAGRVVARVLRAMAQAVRPGVTTLEIDQVGAAVMAEHGARSAPILTYQFPGANCISVNDQAAHGVPGARVIRPGDLVKLDVSAECEGYFADAAITVLVPPVAARSQALYDCARAAFQAGLAAAQAGAPVKRIGQAAEATARERKFRVIAELPGHGIGRALHEAPSVPMVRAGDRRANRPLTEGLVLTIEPHVSAGSSRLVVGDDGWTLSTRDGSPVAAYEHTVVIAGERPVIVTEE
jgi:methionyl aminopeptidase